MYFSHVSQSIEHLQNRYRFVRSQNLKIQVTISFQIRYTFLRVSTILSESKSTDSEVSRFNKDFKKKKKKEKH